MDRASLYWLIWALACGLTFLIPELIAAFSGHPEWKLSAAIWRIQDQITANPQVWQDVGCLLLGFLIYHLFIGSRH